MANWAPKINNTYNFFGCCTIIRSTIFDGDCRIYPKRRFWWEIYERYKILFWDKSTFSSFRLSRNVSFPNISKMYCTYTQWGEIYSSHAIAIKQSNFCRQKLFFPENWDVQDPPRLPLRKKSTRMCVVNYANQNTILS